MLTKEQFDIWCINNQLTNEGKRVIENIRSSQPARRVQSSIKNVPGQYPSRKMGMSIQYESHTLELPFIYVIEHDNTVLEYYDQPNQAKLDYIGVHKNKEKRKVFYYTPDFFIIYKDVAGWVECKPEDKLTELSRLDPYRYRKDEDGRWRCPPGEQYAKAYNLNFYVYSSDQIDWVLLRNIKFLEAYFRHHHALSEDRADKIMTIVHRKQGIELQELLEEVDELGLSADDIYTLIASGGLYCDLKKYVLAEPQYAYVFTDGEKAAAYVHWQTEGTNDSSNMYNGLVLEIGSSLIWDGKEWEIINKGETMLSLRCSQHAIDLSYAQIESYVKQGKIAGVKSKETIQSKIHEVIMNASREECKEANERLQVIKPFLNGELSESVDIPPRTIRSWIANYRNAQQAYGNGYVGLLPRHHDKGNRNSRIPQETCKLLEEWVKEKYETFKQKKMAEVYGDFLIESNLKGISECSYKSFVKFIRRRPIYEQTKNRKGEKAAYRFESYFLEFQLTTVRHGDRPFEIGHIDHSELDIELIDSQTKKNLGRPWATFLSDGCTRKILAVYITFDSPSYRSCMMVLRECVRRFSRLPETLVVDGGKEFSSVYFETVLSAFGSGKKQRPASKPRSGSVLERLFGTTNTRFINNLLGNTQITKNVRQTTKKNNPKKLAVWTYGKFTERLKQFVYEIYDRIGHPALGGQSPQEAFLLGMKKCGDRPWMMIPYDETFRILTLPTSEKGTAKIEPAKGFKNNYIYYWSDAFRHPEVEGSQVPIRYDPYNLGIAYAYVNKRWVQCMSDYHAIFNGKTEKQIQIATKELKIKYQNHSKEFRVNIKILAEFLRDCDSDELFLQQIKDQELHHHVQIVTNRMSEVHKTPVYKTIDLSDATDGNLNVIERYGEF
jgi:putative transposase